MLNHITGSRNVPKVEATTLEVEGSTAPVDEGERTVFVRYTVDTARGAVAPNASVPPIAKNARVDVDFDSQSVASFRRVGGEAKGTIESSLLENVSVTAMYAVRNLYGEKNDLWAVNVDEDYHEEIRETRKVS